jgi:hypothetical protein
MRGVGASPDALVQRDGQLVAVIEVKCKTPFVWTGVYRGA